MTASYNGLATNVQLGRLLNVSSTWTIASNVFINGSYQNTISIAAVGLPYHGYGNSNQTNIPTAQYYNRQIVYRGGKNVASVSPMSTGFGLIGFWLNGVAMLTPVTDTNPPYGYSTPTGFHFNSTYSEGTTLGQTSDYTHWFKQDLAGGRATSSGQYFYNDYTFSNIWTTGLGGSPKSSTIHGLPEISVIPYLNGGLRHPDGHSKILGFALDGYPVYGPYGYTNPTDNTSTVKNLASGYTLKPSSYRVGTTASNTTTYPMGIFVEDYTFANSGDLDTHNGRYCVTPDYPTGTYAYFCTIDNTGHPVYPYVVGNTFYGDVDILTIEEAIGSNTAYPEWVTPSGNLGKIQALQFFELGLQAVDPTGNPDGSDVNYALVAGKLPAGLQIDSSGQVTGNPKDTYSIDGVPEAVTQDRTSNFTVRAISRSGKITDRSFIITVTGNYPPELLTSNYNPLGEFLDGTQISIQLSAVDLNNDTITFSILSGSLPNGVTLSSSGLISGILIPTNNAYPKSTYDFVVEASDGKSFDIKSYSIIVFNHADVTADNAVLTDDNTIFTVDSSNNRQPILLTTSLGSYATFVSGNYFAFKFDAIDYDGVPVGYSSVGTTGTGWDPDTVPWDNAPWDQSNFGLPPGLVLDSNTGWLTGYVPEQTAVSTIYTFAVQAYSKIDTSITSPLSIFSITILGAVNIDVIWNTDNDLGFIDAGSVSQLSVSATAPSGRNLYYTLMSGSRLPQGLTLLNDGTISGRVSFQEFSLDQGKTIFDIGNVAAGIYTSPTTIDRTYTLIIAAQDYSNKVSGERTFTLKVNTVTYSSYDNLYIACSPSVTKRQTLNTILRNTDWFEPQDIYRPNDPWWGLQNDIKILVGYGLTPSQTDSYISAMQTRHYNKKFYFGDYNYASATDSLGNALYDVIYVNLIEDTKTYTTNNGVITKNIPASSFVTKNEVMAYPNDLDLMINDIIIAVGETNTNTLPAWQTSIQENGKTLGFQTAAVLAYLKPGTGPRVLYKLKHDMPNDIKLIPFVADRYILDNNLDSNFDLSTGKWVAKSYTTFDTGYVLSITPSATVDYAIDIPFNSVDSNTVAQIQALGGLDGDSSGDWNGKTIIFSTQENYDPIKFSNLINNGWIQNNAVIPGYAEVQSGTSPVNKRAGVWLITISNNLVTLTFQQEITINQVVAVRFGAKAGETLQYTAATVGIAAQTVPTYESINITTIQLKSPTTFDVKGTVFINNEDQCVTPFTNDTFLKFPRVGIFQ